MSEPHLSLSSVHPSVSRFGPTEAHAPHANVSRLIESSKVTCGQQTGSVALSSVTLSSTDPSRLALSLCLCLLQRTSLSSAVSDNASRLFLSLCLCLLQHISLSSAVSDTASVPIRLSVSAAAYLPLFSRFRHRRLSLSLC